MKTIILNRSFQSHTLFSLLVFISQHFHKSSSSYKIYTRLNYFQFLWWVMLTLISLRCIFSSLQPQSIYPLTSITFTHPLGSRKPLCPTRTHWAQATHAASISPSTILITLVVYAYHVSSLDSMCKAMYVQGPRSPCTQLPPQNLAQSAS